MPRCNFSFKIAYGGIIAVVWRIFTALLVGGFIGWFTNYLAIKLIFRPLNPIEIPLLGLKIQGLIPKRRRDIAKNIARIVDKELLSLNEILDQIINDNNKKVIMESMKVKILNGVEKRIPKLVPGAIKDGILGYVEGIIDREAKDFLDHGIYDLMQSTIGNVSVENLVENKLNQLDLGDLEAIILSISHSELKYIEILGGVLGSLIGLIQALIVEILGKA